MLVGYMGVPTKTTFTNPGASNGEFRWVAGDEIDAVVRNAENVYSGRRYTALDGGGIESRFTMAGCPARRTFFSGKALLTRLLRATTEPSAITLPLIAQV